MKSSSQREIEVKLPVANAEDMIRRIRALGGRCHGRVFEQNALFDTSSAGFRRSGRLLRVRTENSAPNLSIPGGESRTVLTYKAPVERAATKRRKARRRGQLKERLEREVLTSAERDWFATLQHLGFVPGFQYEKYRTTFRLGDLHLDLDETPIGVFLEIEGRPSAIRHTAAALGYSARDYNSGTYWDLYVDACRRRAVAPRNMLFNA